MNFAHRSLFSRPHRRLRSAGVLFALLFVLLRPVCEAFAAPGHQHAAGASAHAALQSASPGGEYANDEFCCASVYAQAVTVPATPPLLSIPHGVLAAPYVATLERADDAALRPNALARRDPAPPLPFHARSLRRLD